MRTATLTCGVLATVLVWASSPAVGQRYQFPSPIPTNTAPGVPAGTGYQTIAGSPAPATPGYPTTTTPGYQTPATPGYGTAPGSGAVPGYGTAPSYGAVPPGSGAAPNYGAAPGYGPGTAPSYGPGLLPGPTATFEGNIQPPPTWDPYATPGCGPATMFPQDPTMPAFPASPSDTITTMQRFLQEIRVDYVWIPGTASNEFGVNDLDLTAEFAIPFLHNPQTPLLITPGFTFHWWNGPFSADPADPDANGRLPPRAYDAYLNAAWNPQFSRVVGGELAFRIGVYSDFEHVVEDSLRYQGYGYGVVSVSPSFQVKAGAIYLDRNRYKLFPAGGVIWTPNDDVRFEILFPNPKLAMRLPGYSTTEWWLYARGEYGGGAWTVEELRLGLFPVDYPVDYNDMRVAVGLDFMTVRGLNGLAEAGIVFDREIFYPTDPFLMGGDFTFRPDPTVFVRAGLAY